MPSSLREAARAGDATADDLASGAAWAHLLTKLQAASATVLAEPASRNPVDMAAGLRHLLVLLWIGIDDALRRDSGAVLAVRPSNTDAVFKWGMDCPDCLYTGAGLRGGDTYRLWGNRGTARYVGLQTMAGMASTANVLLDEIELAPNGDFEIVLVGRRAPGQLDADCGRRHAARRPPLLLRLGDRGRVVAVDRAAVRSAAGAHAVGADRSAAAMARQLVALGDFVEANLDFFLQFATPEAPNTFNPPFDGTAMGAAAENRPVIGSFRLAPDEALVVEVEPPQGLYWSYSIGNPWWETIDYARHQSSLNGSQAVADADGLLRVVIAHEDPGVANWLDTAGHGEGPVILRCVRTETAPVPSTRVVPFAAVAAALPGDTRRVSPEERAAVMDGRARGVAQRFVR